MQRGPEFATLRSCSTGHIVEHFVYVVLLSVVLCQTLIRFTFDVFGLQFRFVHFIVSDIYANVRSAFLRFCFQDNGARHISW